MFEPQPLTWNGTFTCCSGTGCSACSTLACAGSGLGAHTFSGVGVGDEVEIGVFRGRGVTSPLGDGKLTTTSGVSSSPEELPSPPPQAANSASTSNAIPVA